MATSRGESPTQNMALEILEQGMRLEQEGRHFYLEAEGLTAERSGQRLFHTLAEDEEEHMNILQREYASLKAGQRWLGVEMP